MDSHDGENPADLAEMFDDETAALSLTERRLVTQPLDLSIQTLMDQWKESLLVLPDIQREYLWDNGKASRLIESLLLNIPIPVLYFAETDDAKYEIFDGHQRTRSIVRYLNNEFTLVGLAVLREHQGKRFHELSQRDQRFIRMRTLRVILILSESHPNMKFEIYERLNTGSILLNAQELRNSIYRGPLNVLLHDLVKDSMFRALMGSKAPRPRMVDEEMILRFLSMRVGLSSYRPSLKRFLNDFAAREQGGDPDHLTTYRHVFSQTISLIHQTLGVAAFRVLNTSGERLEPAVNRALFEAEMLAFSWTHVGQSRVEFSLVRSSIAQLFSDQAFVDSIQRATGDRSRTLKRVREMVNALLRAGLRVHVPFDLTT